MPSPSRTAPCGAADAQSRLRTARAYLEVADLVLSERERDEHLNVSAGLAVLAGIVLTASAVSGYGPGIAVMTTAAPRTSCAVPLPTVLSWL